MAQSTGAAVDVHDVVTQVQVMHERHRHHGKGLVHFPQIHVFDAPAGLGQRLVHRAHRRGGEPVGLLRMNRVADDAGQRFAAEFVGGGRAHHHQSGGTVVDAGTAGRGDGAVFFEGGFERGNLVELDATGTFIDGNHGIASAALDCDRDDLRGKRAGLGRGLCPLHAVDGELVLLRAREAVFGRAIFTKSAHGAARLVGVFQSVKHHVVKNAVVPDAVTATRLGQQVGGIGHALHATGDQHIRTAGQQHVVCKHGSAHAGATHFGQGDSTRADGQAALERRLARWRLTLAGHQAVAKQHFIDQLAGNPGALHGGPDGGAAQVMGGQRRKVTLEAPHGGAGGADDNDGIGHGELLQ